MGGLQRQDSPEPGFFCCLVQWLQLFRMPSTGTACALVAFLRREMAAATGRASMLQPSGAAAGVQFGHIGKPGRKILTGCSCAAAWIYAAEGRNKPVWCDTSAL